MAEKVNIYRRQNGQYGCSIGHLADAGYEIYSDDDCWRVYNHEGDLIYNGSGYHNMKVAILDNWEAK